MTEEKPTINAELLEERKRSYPILEYFAYSHLPAHLQEISQPLCDLAWQMVLAPTFDPMETDTGLRKLLEAKDCFVRAALPRK